VKLEKKPMELLIFLVGRRDQLVSRREIVAKLWRSDLFIDKERNIDNLVRKLRTTLHNDSVETPLPGNCGRQRLPIHRVRARH
jgi:DNA-binding response OmpR family regulator